MNAASLQRDQAEEAPLVLAPVTGLHFTPLSSETRTHVDTQTMCWHLGFAQQTARLWACKETYPDGLKPIRVSGRLKWPVSGIRKVLGVTQ